MAHYFSAEGVFVDSQFTGSGYPAPVVSDKCPGDGGLLDLFEGCITRLLAYIVKRLDLVREVFGADDVLTAQDESMFDRIFKFPDIPGPVV